MDGSGAAVDGGAADFGKAKCGMEGIRNRVGGNKVDLANYAGVAGFLRALKEIGVECIGVAFAASRSRSNALRRLGKSRKTPLV